MNWRKVISLTLCFILLFVMVLPAQKTEAFVPAFAIPLSAIPASVKISAGAMALGGTVLAGILTGVALHEIDFDIVGKAQDIWNGFSSTIKNAWENLFDSYWGSDVDGIPLDQSFKSQLASDVPFSYVKGSVGVGFGEVERRGRNPLGKSGLGFEFVNNDYYFIVLGPTSFAVYKGLGVFYYTSNYAQGGWELYNRVYYWGNDYPNPNGDLYWGSRDNFWNTANEIFVNIRAIVGYINVHQTSGPTIGIISASAVERFKEMLLDFYESSFPLASANEIHYPLEGIYPYAESLGKDYPLDWNPDLEAFVLPSNPAVPYQGNVGWYIPAPTPYVDRFENVRVGYRLADGTITDALTGEHVGSGVQPIPGEGVDVPEGFFEGVLQGIGTLVGVFTTGLVGDVSNIQWQKLKDVGHDLTNKFPFSIPWDVGRAFNSVFGSVSEGGPPIWEYKVDFWGRQYAFAITIPDYFMNWFPIVRTFILVLFDVGVVLSIRQWLGGAT